MAKIQHEKHFTFFLKSEYLPISIQIQSLNEQRLQLCIKGIYEQCLNEKQGFFSALWL